MFAPLPEFDRVDPHPKTAPEARQRHFAIGKLLLELEEFCLQYTARRDTGRLLGTQAAIWLSLGRLWKYFITSKVLIFHPAGHMHLSIQRVPGKQQADAGLPSS